MFFVDTNLSFVVLILKLEILTQDNKIQQNRLKRIKKLIQSKYHFIAETLVTLNKSDHKKNIDLIDNGKGKKIMDSLRAAFKQFNHTENTLLKEHIIEAKKSVNTVKLIMVYSIFLSLIIFTVTFYTLFQKIKLQHQQ